MLSLSWAILGAAAFQMSRFKLRFDMESVDRAK